MEVMTIMTSLTLRTVAACDTGTIFLTRTPLCLGFILKKSLITGFSSCWEWNPGKGKLVKRSFFFKKRKKRKMKKKKNNNNNKRASRSRLVGRVVAVWVLFVF